ncbi:MAG: hypothetical protein ACRDZ2_11825, partial [Ilumatobacteraceae bacterium]
MGRTHVLAGVAVAVAAFGGMATSAQAAVGGQLGFARIVDEWQPGVPEAGLGGDLRVDGYGVSGLGFYAIELDDGTTAWSVCVQADLGHSRTADYQLRPPATVSAELDYLMWRYASSRERLPGDAEAAAINVLAWRFADARRGDGTAVWRGSDVDVTVDGLGALPEVQAAVTQLGAQATRRRGPWSLDDLGVADGVASVRLSGPGGPISGEPVVFTPVGGAPVTTSTDDAGVATAPIAEAIEVRAEASGPGPTAALEAPGSQRLVIPGPTRTSVITITTPVPTTTTSTAPPVTTTSTTTTTVPPPTTTAAPPPPSTTVTSSTTPMTTSTITTTTTGPPPPTTTAAPSTTTVAPPTTTPPATTSAPASTTTTTTTTTSTTVLAPAPTGPPTTAGAPPTLPRTGG